MSGWRIDKLCERCGVEQFRKFVIMRVRCYPGEIEVAADYKTVAHINPQGCEQSAELIEENRFADEGGR